MLNTALSAQRRRVSGVCARRRCPNRAWSGTPGSAVVLVDSFAVSMAASTKTRCVSKRQVAKWKRLVGRAQDNPIKNQIWCIYAPIACSKSSCLWMMTMMCVYVCLCAWVCVKVVENVWKTEAGFPRFMAILHEKGNSTPLTPRQMTTSMIYIWFWLQLKQHCFWVVLLPKMRDRESATCGCLVFVVCQFAGWFVITLIIIFMWDMECVRFSPWSLLIYSYGACKIYDQQYKHRYR